MSENLKNSNLLQHILDSAEIMKKQKEKKILTVNYVFAAALQFCSDVSSGTISSEFEITEVGTVIRMLCGILLKNDISSCIEQLCVKEETYIDDLLFRQVVALSEKCARDNNKNIVSADIFLSCIMESPTSEIKNIMKSYDVKLCPEGFSNGLEGSENTSESNSTELIENISSTPKEQIVELTKKVKLMQKRLSETVFGQDNAISIIASGYFQSELKNITDKSNKRPRGTYLFAGPPGVGKTFLAEQTAELLGLPFMRFDMSEFSERDALMELIGTNKSFKGDKEGSLTGFVEKNPQCVLLFDEIEKANIAIIHLFLQVLDAGRLRDVNTAKEVDFSKTTIIFTTNAGRKIYENSLTPNLSHISRKTILRALETDVDPKTGIGSFPAAICSRFATGNVIMFNHMEAHSLRKIVENEISRNIKCFEKETGIKCNISDNVYSCILFSEGGHADARTVKSRANSFFSSELYELFRLASNENHDKGTDIEKIKTINISLELPKNEQALRLFRDDLKGVILSFGDADICSKIDFAAEQKGYKNVIASSIEEAKNIISKQDVEFVCCDLLGGKSSDHDELNVEDVDSDGRTFFKYVCASTDVPLYILFDSEHQYSEEEKFSLLKEGARGFVDVCQTDFIESNLSNILMQLHHQQSMLDLAKSSKVVTYETSQTMTSDGETAEIKLFDIALETTIDAEDGGDVLSDVSKPNIRFEDIIGAESAKGELEYFVEYLKNPKTFSSKGLGVPKGVLFYGPPGTGKTMLAKAMAGESGVTFICAEGNQFLKKYVGEGEETVHRLFATARKYAPTIIFIDEIDAIAQERKGGERSSDSILTAFLAEMDGFKTDAKKPIFVLAATNFEIEPGTNKSLDPALLRRFDRHIYIDLPDKKSRIKYINMRTKSNPAFDISDEAIDNIAVRSTGMSLAQIASVFEYSLRMAVRSNKEKVDDSILEEAFESYNYGEERKWDISELRRTAYHEAGHAFLCWDSGEIPAYLTIVARGNHGGYMLHGDNENIGSYTKSMLLNRIRTALGGRAAELVFFGEDEGLTTGASSDLKTATAIAKNMICNYGMDESIGLAVVQENEIANSFMSQKVREAVNEILSSELSKAMKILSNNRMAMDKIVDALLKENHLSANMINEIFAENAVKMGQ